MTSRCPKVRPTTAPDAQTVNGLGNRKNEALLKLIARDGVKVFEGSRQYLQAARDAGLRRIVVSSSANTEQVLKVTGLADLVEGRIDGVTIAHDHLPGKPAPDTFLAGARCAEVEPAQAAVFEDALAGVEAGRAGKFGYVIGVNRLDAAHATSCARTGPTSSCPTSASCCRPTVRRRDPALRVPGRSVADSRNSARPRSAGAVGVIVRARQRPHRPARQPRRGRTARHPWHVS